VRLSVGETKSILTSGPFTLTARCRLIDPTVDRVEIEILARSDESGWVMGAGTPHPAGVDQFMHTFFASDEQWQATGSVKLITPSGVQVTTETTLGVHTFGSDCAVAAMVIG
jgi:hypothetical protein